MKRREGQKAGIELQGQGEVLFLFIVEVEVGVATEVLRIVVDSSSELLCVGLLVQLDLSETELFQKVLIGSHDFDEVYDIGQTIREGIVHCLQIWVDVEFEIVLLCDNEG